MIKHNTVRDIYQKMRLYYGLQKAQRNKKPVPLIINLFLTGRCNSRCTYCYVDIDKKPEKEYTIEQWKHLVDDLYDRGARYFAVLGGEPLLHPYIDELIFHIARKNVFLNLATNAFTIEKHMDAAAMATEISISLDGDKATNNLNRGTHNYEKAVRGIDIAVRAGMKVRLCAVVTKHNINQIDYLIEFAEKRNCCITFSPLIEAAEARKGETEQMRLSDEMVRAFFRKLSAARKTTSCITNSASSLNYLVGYPVVYDQIILKGSAHSDYYKELCPYGRFQYLVTNIGEIYPCGNLWNNPQLFKPKNIFEAGLDETLKHASASLPCQCCSFANAVEWNNLTKPEWLWYGVKLTLKQAFGKGKTSKQF